MYYSHTGQEIEDSEMDAMREDRLADSRKKALQHRLDRMNRYCKKQMVLSFVRRWYDRQMYLQHLAYDHTRYMRANHPDSCLCPGCCPLEYEM